MGGEELGLDQLVESSSGRSQKPHPGQLDVRFLRKPQRMQSPFAVAQNVDSAWVNLASLAQEFQPPLLLRRIVLPAMRRVSLRLARTAFVVASYDTAVSTQRLGELSTTAILSR